jgi:hypothetical protein
MQNDPTPPQQPTQPYSSSAGRVFWAPLLFAAALTVAYLCLLGVLLCFLYTNSDSIADTDWNRMVYVAAALGALVSTAIGWVFGREVHRGAAEVASAAAQSERGAAEAARDEAERAHGEASQSHVKASENAQDAANGRALAAAIKGGPAARELTDDTGGLPSVLQSHLSTLQAMANMLFPDGIDETARLGLTTEATPQPGD